MNLKYIYEQVMALLPPAAGRPLGPEHPAPRGPGNPDRSLSVGLEVRQASSESV